MINKKIVSFIALGALAGVAMLNTQTASAKGVNKVVYNRSLGGAGNSRNVNLTARNAIYSKPGIFKSAKMVVSKSKVRSLKKIQIKTIIISGHTELLKRIKEHITIRSFPLMHNIEVGFMVEKAELDFMVALHHLRQ